VNATNTDASYFQEIIT